MIERLVPWVRRPIPLGMALATALIGFALIAYIELRLEDAIDQNQVQEQRLGPPERVEAVAPCRTFDIRNPECRRQSRLINRSCTVNELTEACRASVALLICVTERLTPTCRILAGLLEAAEGGDARHSGSTPGQLGSPPSGGPPRNPGPILNPFDPGRPPPGISAPMPPPRPLLAEAEEVLERTCDALAIECPDPGLTELPVP